jgi:hypothetical protein
VRKLIENDLIVMGCLVVNVWVSQQVEFLYGDAKLPDEKIVILESQFSFSCVEKVEACNWSWIRVYWGSGVQGTLKPALGPLLVFLGGSLYDSGLLVSIYVLGLAL